MVFLTTGQAEHAYPPRKTDDSHELRTRLNASSSSAPATTRNDPSSRSSSFVPQRLPPPVYLPFIPLVLFPLWGLASALVMATIIGFSLSAVYNTAGFEMST